MAASLRRSPDGWTRRAAHGGHGSLLGPSRMRWCRAGFRTVGRHSFAWVLTVSLGRFRRPSLVEGDGRAWVALWKCVRARCTADERVGAAAAGPYRRARAAASRFELALGDFELALGELELALGSELLDGGDHRRRERRLREVVARGVLLAVGALLAHLGDLDGAVLDV